MVKKKWFIVFLIVSLSLTGSVLLFGKKVLSSAWESNGSSMLRAIGNPVGQTTNQSEGAIFEAIGIVKVMKRTSELERCIGAITPTSK